MKRFEEKLSISHPIPVLRYEIMTNSKLTPKLDVNVINSKDVIQHLYRLEC